MCLCESDSNGCSRKNTFVPKCRAEVCRIIYLCVCAEQNQMESERRRCSVEYEHRDQSDDCVVGLYLGTCAFRGNLQTIELFLSAAWKIVFINMITHRNGMIARASFLNFSSSSQSRSTRTQLHSFNFPTKATHIQILQMENQAEFIRKSATSDRDNNQNEI